MVLRRARLLRQVPQKAVLALASVVQGLALKERGGRGEVRHRRDGQVVRGVRVRVDVQVREGVGDGPGGQGAARVHADRRGRGRRRAGH